MILADTSIWISHFRFANADLIHQLDTRNLAIHPFVVAELALGSLTDRTRTLAFLDGLPSLPMAQLNEVRQMVEGRSLYSQGIGLIDAHLIASVLLSYHALLWTADNRLRKVAEDLGICALLP